MAKAFARKFYSSKAWQDCRNEYAKRQHFLCEDCLRRGIYKPGTIVHHKIEIDPVTIEKPEIALNFNNLELLCRDCCGYCLLDPALPHTRAVLAERALLRSRIVSSIVLLHSF